MLTSTTEIDSNDRVMEQMFAWCSKQKEVVVLKSASILAVDPTSRIVQNCKSVLLSKGVFPGHVYTASPQLIGMLLASAQVEEVSKVQKKGEAAPEFSDQQKNLRNLVNEAVARDVSDIHIEVRRVGTKVRMRQNGELSLYAEWSERMGREIASVAFNKETDHATSHFNPLIPQDASMPLKIQGKDVRLRLASVPAHGGFDMVMRILAAGETQKVTLEELGYTKKQVEIIQRAMKLPHGAVIVSGPTGSGKTTTLAACMEMVEPVQKLYSIEDPVEKVVDKATQVPANTEKEDRNFASLGKAALRMDPDVIILGEMRDEDTASVMVRASITGHLVLSTLHTNRAPAIITRMVDMGISPVLLGDSSVLRCLICQRLVVKVCDHCAIPVVSSEKHAADLERWISVIGEEGMKNARARGPGCQHCNDSGVGGRTVVAEVIWVDEDGRRFIQQQDTIGWEKYLKENHWPDYHDRAIELVKEGVCDPFDAERVSGRIDAANKATKFDYQEL